MDVVGMDGLITGTTKNQVIHHLKETSKVSKIWWRILSFHCNEQWHPTFSCAETRYRVSFSDKIFNQNLVPGILISWYYLVLE